MPSLRAVLGLDASQYHTNLEGAVDHANSAGRKMEGSFAGALGEKLAEFASFAAVEEGARRLVEYAEKVEMVSNRLGMSTESVQRWDYVLSQNGGNIEQATTILEKLAQSRQKVVEGDAGWEKLADSFRKLGVSIEDLKNKDIGREDLLKKIGETFEHGNPEELIGAFRSLGGKSAGTFVAAFRNEFAKKFAEAPVAAEENLAELQSIGEGTKSILSKIKALGVDATGTVAGGFRVAFGTVIAGASGLAKGLEGTFDKWRSGEALKPGDPTKNFGSIFQSIKSNIEDYLQGTALMEIDRRDRKSSVEKAAAAPETKELSFEELKEIDRLGKEAAKIRREAAIAEVSGVMKARAITEEIAELKSRMAVEKDDVQKARLNVELAQKEVALARVQAETQKEVQRIKEQTSKRAFENSLAEMTTVQKIAAYQKEISRLEKEKGTAGGDEKRKAEIELEQERLKGEMQRTRKEAEREEERERAKLGRAFQQSLSEVEANVKIGAYGGDPMLNVGKATQKSEQHLAHIHKTLQEHTKILRRTRY